MLEFQSKKTILDDGTQEFRKTKVLRILYSHSPRVNFATISNTLAHNTFPRPVAYIFQLSFLLNVRPNYLFKVNDGNARKRCEICSKLLIQTPQGSH